MWVEINYRTWALTTTDGEVIAMVTKLSGGLYDSGLYEFNGRLFVDLESAKKAAEKKTCAR